MTSAAGAVHPPRFRRLLHELGRFGVVGAAAFVIELGVFNLLRYGPGEVLATQPLTAKVLAGVVAMLAAWLGNRHWTFSTNKSRSTWRELLAYTLVNVAGVGTSVVTLWVSHYVLGFTSPLADNISGNIIGIGLGTIVRYLGYKFLVFTAIAPADTVDDESRTGGAGAQLYRPGTASATAERTPGPHRTNDGAPAS